MQRNLKFKKWSFKDILKQKAIVNNQGNDKQNRQALYQVQKMAADGTLAWFYVQLRRLMEDAINDQQLPLRLLKDAMLESIYKKDGQYILHLKKGDQYATVFGSIILDKKVSDEMVQINHLYELAQYSDPLPRTQTDALKPYFEICKQKNAHTFFPRNVIRGYIDAMGQARIASNLSTWDESLIADALKQLESTEDISGHFNGNDIVFNGIE